MKKLFRLRQQKKIVLPLQWLPLLAVLALVAQTALAQAGFQTTVPTDILTQFRNQRTPLDNQRLDLRKPALRNSGANRIHLERRHNGA